MKYFIVNTTILDGEFEYLSQSPYRARTYLGALAQAEKDAKAWTTNTYREYEVGLRAEITKEDYLTISKFIY